jgi:transposase-like protein
VRQYRSKNIHARRQIASLVEDETMIQIDNDAARLWIAIGHVNKTVQGINISKYWTLLLAEIFLKTLINV